MDNTKSLTSSNTSNLFLSLFFGVIICLISACNLPNVLPDPTLEVTVDGDQMVDFGTEVTLNGFASHSSGTSSDVLWEIISKPTSSSLALSNANQTSITFLPDVLGEYIFRFTATSSDGLTAFEEVILTVIKAPVRLSGSITNDMVLENIYEDPSDPDYLVSGTLLVRADLTIDEDVLIIFEENAGIEIQSEGSLSAVGSESAPIIMTGVQKTAGFWRGLNFKSRNPDNQLKFTTVEYGGSGGFDGANRKANVTLHDAIVKISNCTITHSGGDGLLTRIKEDELPEFNNNVVTNNITPVEINKSQYHYLDASSDFSGNVDDYINSWGQNSLDRNVTWNALNVPYRFGPRIERIESELTIEKGAEFIGQPNSGLQILPEGSIIAVGSASEPILFKGEQDVRGYWMGLSIGSNTDRNELQYVSINNGGERGFDGGNRKSNLIMEDAVRLKMRNCTLTKSAEFGLIIRDLRGIITLFENNTITDNKMPIECKMNHFHYFDNASDLTGNDEDAILTSWANSPTDVDATWRKTTAPYKILKADYIASTITIEPGVEIIGMDNAGIDVRENGTLIAIGTPSERIIIRGEEDVQGFWKGVRIMSNNTSNEMTYVTISNGGSSGFDGANRKSNVEVGVNAMLKLTNSLIEDSKGYGVRVLKEATLIAIDNIFINNKEGDIFYD